MFVVIPSINADNSTIVWRPMIEKDHMINKLKNNEQENLIYFENKQPVWNKEMNAYVLNFSSKLAVASVKNFQLIKPFDGIIYK